MLFATQKKLQDLKDDALYDRDIFWESVRRTVPQVAKPLVIGVSAALLLSVLFGGVGTLGVTCLGAAIVAGACVSLSTWCFATRETRLMAAERKDRAARAAEIQPAPAAPRPAIDLDLGHAFRLGTSKAVAVKTLKLKASKPRHGFFH